MLNSGDLRKKLAAQRSAVDTSPTEKQKTAGNYRHGHISVHGYEISIENPKGSYRKGVDGNGKEWKVLMKHDYGYFVKTKGKDGDAIDVFIGDNLDSMKIFVVDQKFGRKFDESKVMLCFSDIESAKKGYLSNYSDDWKGFWKITEVDDKCFKKWLYDRKRQYKPFFKYKEISDYKKMNRKVSVTEETLRRIVTEAVTKIISDIK